MFKENHVVKLSTLYQAGLETYEKIMRRNSWLSDKTILYAIQVINNEVVAHWVGVGGGPTKSDPQPEKPISPMWNDKSILMFFCHTTYAL